MDAPCTPPRFYTPPPTTPSGIHPIRTRGRRYRKQLTRDQRLQIRTLHDDGRSVNHIARRFRYSPCQVRRAIPVGATPRKGRGRKYKLSEDELNYTIQWIQSSWENRRKNYNQIAQELRLGICGETLRLHLASRGIKSYRAVKKPPVDMEYRRQRRLD
ncbi:hypothetical protein N7486_009454 [Penicillium sp. IBT 16267x]|nr:hypothetical protein N7486_009454 [Penicillium sp. IBT 16267x]